ncbi:hypothetical protein FE634_18535 [Nocardioides dongxiaopingii]|uniref:hypothetical protein n=1 Tax=Nocardioides sp. S-1144 TaxID=2582905 RepID=UPI00110D8EC3|nr:hypothetical protein [Nocardioides sp. S-1144]QCW51902.1 hypothetical protein FE634_18535 [Nocardioides sp. S-1144]
MDTPAAAFALASVLHAGFQVTVTTLVYPALASRGAEDWQVAHDRHSRAIVPLVAVVYVALLATGAFLLASGPDAVAWLGLGGAASALAVTATLAAPTHGRLTDRDEALVARLLVVDRWRCAAAVLGAVASVAALAG